MDALFKRSFLLFVYVYLFLTQKIEAQPVFKNEVSFSTSLTILPPLEVRLKSLFNQFQISYEHSFNCISFQASYSFWNTKALVDDVIGGGLTYF